VEDEISCITPMAFLRRTVAATIRTMQLAMPEGTKSVHGAISNQHDIAAAAAIATIRATPGYELLTVEADEPVSTITAIGQNLSRINQRSTPIGNSYIHYRWVGSVGIGEMKLAKGKATRKTSDM
jgi:hypothetical protein